LLDDMFSKSVLYNSACICCANPIRIRPIIMCILFHHYKELSKIEELISRHNNSMTKGTFIGMSKATPAEFQFLVKVPETITHKKD